MPAGPRIRTNNVFGLVSDNPLPAAAITVNSAGLANLPVVASAHAVITLDPLRVNGAPEIIVVTAHGSLATVATVTRGAYGTTARAHPQGTLWTHTPVTEDFLSVLTSATRPSDPYRGESIFETDTNRYIGRSTADVWQQDGLFFDPPYCRVFQGVNISVANNSQVVLGIGATSTVYGSEHFDTDNMHSNSTNPGRITFNTPGIYIVELHIEWATNGTGQRYAFIRLNGTTSIGYVSQNSASVTNNVGQTVVTLWKFAVNDYVESVVFQDSGAPLNILFNASSSAEFGACWIGRGN